MDYKKKYEALVGGIKGWLDKYVGDWRRGVFNLPFDKTGEIAKDIIKLVPELREDDGERIRRCLLDFIKNNSETPFTLYEEFTPQQYISYLEKQREQKPAEWSAVDEEMLDAMKDIVSNALYEPLCPREGMLAWLEALRPVKKGLGEADVDAMVKEFSDNLPLCGEFQTYHDALAYTYRQGIEAVLNALYPNSK